ncbi:hypothetical protein, partial [Rhodopseudomonas sp. BAL398]|uniref:hypothetical protein n=1 Tax=Rhodopseudomonas sp. BAL398 TaxID=3034676 RepID=UPI0023E1B06A
GPPGGPPGGGGAPGAPPPPPGGGGAGAPPPRLAYMDQAMTPVAAEDENELAIFTQTAAAKDAVAHRNKVLKLTRGAA